METADYYCKECDLYLEDVQVENGSKHCPECGGFMERQAPPDTYSAITDRIGKAYRQGDSSRAVSESLVLREKLKDDLKRPVKRIKKVLPGA